MSGFAPTCAGVSGLDPSKRVNYRLGLVLGEDEFRQDQFHLRERDQYATRVLHGYGTVSGLGVSMDGGGRLHVLPGVAVDPAGRLICVPVEYCGSLEGWLNDPTSFGPDDVSGIGPSGELSVYVVLCWTECETDEVPIPSSSCLSAEDSRAASRLMDSFELRLTLEPPPVVGEVAETSLGDGLADLVDQLHGLLDVSSGAPVDSEGVAGLLREWAVERRPEVAADQACLPAPADACLLLARVDVVVDETPSGRQVTSALVDDADRPILVSTRLLQEALFAVAADEEVPPHDHALAGLVDVDLSAPVNVNDGLLFDGSHWVSGAVGVNSHHELTGRDADDHPHYLRADGTRSLTGDWSADGHRITDLPFSNAANQPVVHGQGAGGDLAGTYPNPTLGAIQGTPVVAGTVDERDVLVVRDGQWMPAQQRILPLATITPWNVERVERKYLVWFNLDAPGNSVEVEEGTLRDNALEVYREDDRGVRFLVRVGPESIERLRRNLFAVEIRQEVTLLRFLFDIRRIELTQGGSVRDWADKAGFTFEGQGQRDEPVTVFSLRADLIKAP